jgi:hypothetical protein
MEQLTELPAVAKTVYHQCKKCALETAHTVLAHKSATSASIQCTTCKSKKTLSLAAEKKKATAGTKVRKTKNDAPAVWEKLNAKIGSEDAVPYTMAGEYKLEQAINHPTFGIGYITNVSGSRIEVAFLDSTKILVQKS